MHAVSATDHRRSPMFERAPANDLGESIEIRKNQIARLTHLNRLRRIDDIGRRHSEMHPARRIADVFGDRGREGDQIVLGFAFDGFDRAANPWIGCRQKPNPRHHE